MKDAFPDHLRLSIHESFGEHKVSISLLNTRTGFTTPWHCSVAQLADGEWISAPMGEFQKDSRLELIYEDGRPSYFREKPRDPNSPHDESWATFMLPKKLGPLSTGSSSPSLQSEGSTFTVSAESPSSQLGLGISGCSSLSGSICAPEMGATKTATSTVPASQDYGRRLLPQIVDNLAASHPNQIVFSLSSMVKGTLQFRDISARQFAKAIDKTAWWLQAAIGRQDSIQPIGYIGPRKYFSIHFE